MGGYRWISTPDRGEILESRYVMETFRKFLANPHSKEIHVIVRHFAPDSRVNR